MADLTKRLEATVSESARRRLLMLALAEDKSPSRVLDAHLLATLPTADELANRLRGTESVPA